MKLSICQTKHFKATSLKVITVFALASMINAISISTAFADRNDERGRGEQQRDDRGGRGDHGGSQRDYRDGHGHRYGNQYENRRGYSYEQPVYVPPPVYYEPARRSPGIDLFFPLDLRR